MKKFVLLAAIACSSLAAMAQVDITPSRYVFADQEVGVYALDNVGNTEGGTGSNPLANWQRVVDDWNNGYFIINNGQMTALDKPNTVAFQQGCQIVDLGGAVGKVLAIKGINSEYEYGVASQTEMAVGWYNLSWYLQQGTCPQDKPIRFQVVFKIYENTPDMTNGWMRFDSYTFANNHCSGFTEVDADKATTTKVWKSGDFIARWEDDNSPKEDDNGNAYFDDELWQQVEFDWQAFSEDGDADPLRLSMHFQGGKHNTACVLIKSIKAIQAPEGDPECKPVTFGADPEAINTLLQGTNVSHSYDLQGRRATESTKGIVITDGKKIVK